MARLTGNIKTIHRQIWFSHVLIQFVKKTLSNFSSVFRECVAESKKLRELGKMKCLHL
jgi:hypothetical protein